MRLTPAQVGMECLLGTTNPWLLAKSGGTRKLAIRCGREFLVQITGQDFGYDAVRWHEYLWATDDGSYRWCRRSPGNYLRQVRRAVADPGRAEAVAELEAEEAELGPTG